MPIRPSSRKIDRVRLKIRYEKLVESGSIDGCRRADKHIRNFHLSTLYICIYCQNKLSECLLIAAFSHYLRRFL